MNHGYVVKVVISLKGCQLGATLSIKSKTWVTSASLTPFVPVAMSPQKNGCEYLNLTAFYEALPEAKGVSLGLSGVGSVGKGGRKLSYMATV